MNQTYKTTLSQYALPPSLPSWGDLEGCSLKAMMFEKYPSISPYTYCMNNPVGLIDPTGMTAGDFYDWSGNRLGWDGEVNDNVHFVSDKESIKTIKQNDKVEGGSTSTDKVTIDVTTTKSVISEIISVNNRTQDNGEKREEATFLTTDGKYTGQGPSIDEISYDQNANVEVTYSGDINVTIHSHLPKRINPQKNGLFKTASAFRPSERDNELSSAMLNIITGSLGDTQWLETGGFYTPERGAVFFDSNWNYLGHISIKKLSKIK